MYKKKMTLKSAMNLIQDVADIDLSIEGLPDQEQLKQDIDNFLEELQREFDELAPEFDRLLSDEIAVKKIPVGAAVEATLTPAVRGSKRTTIRIPAQIFSALHAKASELGIGYQTLIIRLLRNEVMGGFPGFNVRA